MFKEGKRPVSSLTRPLVLLLPLQWLPQLQKAMPYFFFNSRMKYSYTTKKYKVILDIFYITHVSYKEIW